MNNWQPIDTAPNNTPIMLRFRHAIGHFELRESCRKVGGWFYRDRAKFVELKVIPEKWAPYAPA